MMKSMHLLAGMLASAAIAAPGAAADNAALGRYGATIKVTCKAPSPLNDRWNKPVNMLRDEKPAGPIINDLSTGEISIGFPLKLHVTRVGIKQGDYRGSFAKAKDITIVAAGTTKRHTLQNRPGEVQFVELVQ